MEGLIDPGNIITKSKIYIHDRWRISRYSTQNRYSILHDRATLTASLIFAS